MTRVGQPEGTADNVGLRDGTPEGTAEMTEGSEDGMIETESSEDGMIETEGSEDRMIETEGSEDGMLETDGFDDGCFLMQFNAAKSLGFVLYGVVPKSTCFNICIPYLN